MAAHAGASTFSCSKSKAVSGLSVATFSITFTNAGDLALEKTTQIDGWRWSMNLEGDQINESKFRLGVAPAPPPHQQVQDRLLRHRPVLVQQLLGPLPEPADILARPASPSPSNLKSLQNSLALPRTLAVLLHSMPHWFKFHLACWQLWWRSSCQSCIVPSAKSPVPWREQHPTLKPVWHQACHGARSVFPFAANNAEANVHLRKDVAVPLQGDNHQDHQLQADRIRGQLLQNFPISARISCSKCCAPGMKWHEWNGSRIEHDGENEETSSTWS